MCLYQETRERLNKMRGPRYRTTKFETYDTVIIRLLDFWDEHKGEGDNDADKENSKN